MCSKRQRWVRRKHTLSPLLGNARQPILWPSRSKCYLRAHAIKNVLAKASERHTQVHPQLQRMPEQQNRQAETKRFAYARTETYVTRTVVQYGFHDRFAKSTVHGTDI